MSAKDGKSSYHLEVETCGCAVPSHVDLEPYSESDCDLELPPEGFENDILSNLKNGFQSHVRSDSDSTTASFLPSSGSTQSLDSDLSSGASNNSANRNRYLFPHLDTVEIQRPEEVRWMYKDIGDKKWTAFIGYDSLRIECKHRETLQRSKSEDICEFDEDAERVIVRGGLYEVDVMKRKCYPIYWTLKDDVTTIIRGTWFLDNSWQPIEESYADEIEAEHLAKFERQKLHQEEIETTKGPTPVVHNIKFKEFHVDWNSMNKIYMHSETASSKFVRAVGTKLGLSKTGSRLRRGYHDEAKMDDKPPDITHLIFVIHGIGQKMETGSIIKSCKDLRITCKKLKDKYFPDLDTENKRVEFLPVEWRSSLRLDGDTVESITPNKVKGLRTMLNSSAMDILYYTSPLYRSEITQGLQTELNKLYEMFSLRHPYFEASGGKVSVVAHSLGCVITYDIITGWNPIQLYDQYVSNFIVKKCEHVENCSHLLAELEQTRQRVSAIEEQIFKLAEEQHLKTPTLLFKLDNFFCLGSPLAVFLALRGIRPQGGTTQDHILPRTLCSRLCNIYHPSDPVAYRLEPLIIKEYAKYKPAKIHRYDASKKEPYDEMPLVPISHNVLQSLADSLTDDSDKTETGEHTDSEKSCGKESDLNMKTSPSKGNWSFVFRRNKKNNSKLRSISGTDLAAISSDSIDDDTIVINDSSTEGAESTCDLTIDRAEKHADPRLEHRIDFQLKEGKMENAYIAALTSHTSYWNQQDIALFIMTQIFPTHGPR